MGWEYLNGTYFITGQWMYRANDEQYEVNTFVASSKPAGTAHKVYWM